MNRRAEPRRDARRTVEARPQPTLDPGRALRLADVAAVAGVSEATVSRVVNNKPGVATGTRRSVMDALDSLGYQRPATARRTALGVVGLIVPELVNPIFPAFAQSITSVLAHHGYTTLLGSQSLGGLHEDDYVQMLLERGIDGLIIVSGFHADTTASVERYVDLVEAKVPLVLVNGYADGVDAPFISTDDAASVHLAVSHLASLGHRRIGLAVGPTRYVPVIRKMAGFAEAMRDIVAPREVDELIETGLFTVEGGAAAAGRLLDRGCTAVICASDIMALGAIREAHQRGLRVPGDISVVGFDDALFAEHTDPPLTTIRQSVDAMSEAAVRTLLNEIAGTPVTTGEYAFRPVLVVRGSTGAAPSPT